MSTKIIILLYIYYILSLLNSEHVYIYLQKIHIHYAKIKSNDSYLTTIHIHKKYYMYYILSSLKSEHVYIYTQKIHIHYTIHIK